MSNKNWKEKGEKREWQYECKNSFIICDEVFKVHLKTILSNKD